MIKENSGECHASGRVYCLSIDSRLWGEARHTAGYDPCNPRQEGIIALIENPFRAFDRTKNTISTPRRIGRK